jgi:uncharacterized membrane protein YtjA (UPF0391 family)
MIRPGINSIHSGAGTAGVWDGPMAPALLYPPWRHPVLRWALAFLVIAMIAAVFGFTGIATGAREIARDCCFFFVVFFVVSLVWGLAPGRRIAPPL